MDGVLLFLYGWLGGKILDKITALFVPKELRERFAKHFYENFKKLKDESTKMNERTTPEGLYPEGVLNWMRRKGFVFVRRRLNEDIQKHNLL